MGELWLFRHGETEWTITKQHTGRHDIPMTEAGERRALALRKFLKGKSFHQVLVSHLRRAKDICHLAGYMDVAKITPDIAEWDYGDYEGRTPEEIRSEVPDWTIWTKGCPGGETLEQVALRAKKIMNEVADIDGDVALFSHGHFLRIFTACWFELHPSAARLLMLDTSSLSILSNEKGKRVLKCWNVATPGSFK